MSTVPVFQLYSRGQLHARAVRGREAMPGRQGCGPSPPQNVLSLHFFCGQRRGVHSSACCYMQLLSNRAKRTGRSWDPEKRDGVCRRNEKN
jgi:hypothetical protein